MSACELSSEGYPFSLALTCGEVTHRLDLSRARCDGPERGPGGQLLLRLHDLTEDGVSVAAVTVTVPPDQSLLVQRLLYLCGPSANIRIREPLETRAKECSEEARPRPLLPLTRACVVFIGSGGRDPTKKLHAKADADRVHDAFAALFGELRPWDSVREELPATGSVWVRLVEGDPPQLTEEQILDTIENVRSKIIAADDHTDFLVYVHLSGHGTEQGELVINASTTVAVSRILQRLLPLKEDVESWPGLPNDRFWGQRVVVVADMCHGCRWLAPSPKHCRCCMLGVKRVLAKGLGMSSQTCSHTYRPRAEPAESAQGFVFVSASGHERTAAHDQAQGGLFTRFLLETLRALRVDQKTVERAVRVGDFLMQTFLADKTETQEPTVFASGYRPGDIRLAPGVIVAPEESEEGVPVERLEDLFPVESPLPLSREAQGGPAIGPMPSTVTLAAAEMLQSLEVSSSTA